MSFSKVNLGLSPNGTNKKSFFNLGCDSHFSTNFGRYVPIYSAELLPGSHVDLNIRNLVRLSPLVVPTAGRMNVHYYVNYVPFKELYKPFDCFLSKQNFPFYYQEAIPSEVPSIKLYDLYRAFLDYDVYSGSLTDYGQLDTVFTQLSSTNSGFETVALNVLKVTTYYAFFKCVDGIFKVHYNYDDEQLVIEPVDTSISNLLVFPTASVYDVSTHPLSSTQYIRFGSFHTKVNQILTGLGYPYSFNGYGYSNAPKYSILPLMAFYYSWFRLFGIERHKNFESTYCYKLQMNFIHRNGQYNSELFKYFVYECINCFYTFAPDYFTSQVQNSADNQNMTEFSYAAKINSLSDVEYLGSDTSQLYGSETDFSQSSIGQRIAQRLLRLVNMNTVFGHSVEKYLRNIYPGIHFDKKHDSFIGSYRVNINVDDIWSTSDTDNAVLGDYAGKAIGSGSSPHFSFDTDYHGILLICACVVPEPGYYQATNGLTKHVYADDFYNREFDALGYTPTTLRDFISECSDYSNTYMADGVIGLKPRYQEYKWHPNVITGVLRNRSQMSTYRGYYLDRFFDTPMIGNLTNDELRILDDSSDKFNLNRIFTDYNAFDDHFLVFNVIDCKVTSNMIPIEDTFVEPDIEKRGDVQASRS